MKNIVISYDKTNKVLEIFDPEGKQYIEVEDVEQLIGNGVKLDHTEDQIDISIPELYIVQMWNPVSGAYTDMATCQSNAVDYVFDGLIRAFPKDDLRVLRSSDLSKYKVYKPTII